MRPVNRGECPSDGAGNPRVFPEYDHARPFLIDNIGGYCSYCEMPIGSGLAVEHIRHKKANLDLECEWSNFLLACTNCNSTKETKVETQADVDARLWPHLDRTFDVFVYGRDGSVQLASLADPELAARAKATEEMVQLRRRPGLGLSVDQDNTSSDRRWELRMQAWNEAVEARECLREQDTPVTRQLISNLARARGFWSVWMTVFADDEDMQQALCEGTCFPGTVRERVYPLPAHARRRASP